jgi:ABC-2 type transport system permease protein
LAATKIASLIFRPERRFFAFISFQSLTRPRLSSLEGVFPGALSDKHFRLVMSGTSKFATNEYFSYVSNGGLSVAIMRWLTEDDASPNLAPRTYNLPEIVLTSAQMRDTFVVLEVLLPVSTALFGVAMWWRRR